MWYLKCLLIKFLEDIKILHINFLKIKI